MAAAAVTSTRSALRDFERDPGFLAQYILLNPHVFARQEDIMKATARSVAITALALNAQLVSICWLWAGCRFHHRLMARAGSNLGMVQGPNPIHMYMRATPCWLQGNWGSHLEKTEGGSPARKGDNAI